MEWLAQNWVWVLLIGAFIAMHLFGHGGHGHGGRQDDRKSREGDSERRAARQPQAHRH